MAMLIADKAQYVSGPLHLLRAKLRTRFAPATQQSAEVKDSLVKALYASPASLLSGAISGGALGFAVAYAARLTPITVISALILIVGISRSISEIGRAVQQECRDRSRMPSSA
eukprot:TRINITY_DN76005_c0_g1_i1.p2 TRINITY_DN76005_c0_g1~~TRINITY_DN76005_c0_g1_i1.p2  ORF type:complete len:126 (+),score=30.20 TRINITY_DN76005_c0_g1_i1:42-380(+)